MKMGRSHIKRLLLIMLYIYHDIDQQAPYDLYTILQF
jgi:hypothetical protein